MITRYKENDRDGIIINDITSRIIRNIEAWYGPASRILSQTPTIQSHTNSFLLRYPVITTQGHKAILVKIRRHPKRNSLTQAVHSKNLHTLIPAEYEELQLVHDKIGGDHKDFSAIRPLAYFEDYFAIVMEEFPSRSLRQILESRKLGTNKGFDLKTIACKAGELLRFFHQRVHSIIERPYSARDFLADVHSYAVRLEDCSHGRIKAATILDAFSRELARREIRSIPFTNIHLDLTCDNVLFSEDGKVCLIDIKTRLAPIYQDLALLLIHPETFRKQIFRGGLYFSRTTIKNYWDSIVRGYFAGTSMDEFLLKIFCAIQVLNKWTMQEELLHGYKGIKWVLTRPLAPLVTLYFQRLLNRYLRTAA